MPCLYCLNLDNTVPIVKSLSINIFCLLRRKMANIIDSQIKKLNAGEYRGRSQRAKGCIKLAPLTANPND